LGTNFLRYFDLERSDETGPGMRCAAAAAAAAAAADDDDDDDDDAEPITIRG